MKFNTSTTMTKILDALFTVYSERVPDVKKITSEMVNKGIKNFQNRWAKPKKQSSIYNDVC